MTGGVLVIDKPSGLTSFDVVRRVRRAAKIKRVGHGGTLDPLATGVLPVCVGEATKLTQFLLDADKEYGVTICFGVETDTDDAMGSVVARHDATGLSAAAVESALGAFRGAIAQVPPDYSALKRAGRPLYDYARAGTPLTVPARTVEVYALRLISFDGPDRVELAVRCSKGTYVRALARDLGRVLGVGGHVTALRRARSGPFSLTDARPLDQVLDALSAGAGAATGGALPAVMSIEAALAHLPRRSVSDEVARDLRVGRRVALSAILGGEELDASPSTRLCVLDGRGALVTVGEPRPDGTLRTLRVFQGVAAANEKLACDGLRH